MGHTKGPWVYSVGPAHSSIMGNGGTSIVIDKPKYLSNEDAALILAAPEMLELLEYIRDNEILDMDSETIKRVIKKARGEK